MKNERVNVKYVNLDLDVNLEYKVIQLAALNV